MQGTADMSPPLTIECAGNLLIQMEASLPHHFPTRQLHDSTIFHSSPYPPHSNISSQQDIGLDDFHFDPRLASEPQLHQPQREDAFEANSFDASRTPQLRFQEIRSNPSVSSPQSNNVFDPSNAGVFGVLSGTRPQLNSESGQGQFGILSPPSQLDSRLVNPHRSHDEQLGRLQHELGLRPVTVTDGGTTEGHFSNMKMVPDPPHLEQWRRRLFDVDEAITLTEEQ